MPACKGFRNTPLFILCLKLQPEIKLKETEHKDSMIQTWCAAVIRFVTRIMTREEEDLKKKIQIYI